jgi:transposase
MKAEKREVTMIVAIIGIELGRSVCSMTGLDQAGAVVRRRRRVSRGKLVELLARTPYCVVAMEACCGAHHLGRVFARKVTRCR